MWATTEILALDADSLPALVAGELPAVRLEQFASADEGRELCGLLLDEAIRTQSVEEVTRLGISQYEQGLRGSKGAYFEQARSLTPVFRRIFDRSFDPVGRLITALRGVGIDADVMVEPGYGPYWAGTGKLRRGVSPIHVDFAPQDSAGWAVADTRAQLAWNLYLDNPGGGGDLLVWDRPWCPEDDAAHQVEGEYRYRPDVVVGAPCLQVPVTVGDVLLLNSACYHAVGEAEDRMAFGSFVSVFDDGRFRLWS